jgi:hypothetical protein
LRNGVKQFSVLPDKSAVKSATDWLSGPIQQLAGVNSLVKPLQELSIGYRQRLACFWTAENLEQLGIDHKLEVWSAPLKAA